MIVIASPVRRAQPPATYILNNPFLGNMSTFQNDDYVQINKVLTNSKSQEMLEDTIRQVHGHPAEQDDSLAPAPLADSASKLSPYGRDPAPALHQQSQQQLATQLAAQAPTLKLQQNAVNYYPPLAAQQQPVISFKNYAGIFSNQLAPQPEQPIRKLYEQISNMSSSKRANQNFELWLQQSTVRDKNLIQINAITQGVAQPNAQNYKTTTYSQQVSLAQLQQPPAALSKGVSTILENNPQMRSKAQPHGQQHGQPHGQPQGQNRLSEKPSPMTEFRQSVERRLQANFGNVPPKKRSEDRHSYFQSKGHNISINQSTQDYTGGEMLIRDRLNPSTKAQNNQHRYY